MVAPTGLLSSSAIILGELPNDRQSSISRNKMSASCASLYTVINFWVHALPPLSARLSDPERPLRWEPCHLAAASPTSEPAYRVTFSRSEVHRRHGLQGRQAAAVSSWKSPVARFPYPTPMEGTAPTLCNSNIDRANTQTSALPAICPSRGWRTHEWHGTCVRICGELVDFLHRRCR